MPFWIYKVLDHYDHLGVAAPKSCGRKRLTDLINNSVTEVFVEQPLASPGSAKYMVGWKNQMLNFLIFNFSLVLMKVRSPLTRHN